MIRTRERVRDLGEVFTQRWTVDAMLDLLPPSTWTDPTTTILEPSCGDGNFLVAAAERKMQHNPDPDPVRRALRTLSTLYAVDISPINITAARGRLHTAVGLPDHPAARWITRNNIRLGDMSPTGNWRTIPVLGYTWHPDGSITITRTDYGTIVRNNTPSIDDGALFGVAELDPPTRYWRGSAADLHTAPVAKHSRRNR